MSSSKLKSKAFSNPVEEDVSADFLSRPIPQEEKKPDTVEQEEPPKKKNPHGGRAPKPKSERKRQTPSVRKSGVENKSSETAVVALSSDLKKKLEKLSTFQNQSMSQIMRTALEDYIDAHYEEAKRAFRAMLDEEE